MPTSAIVGLSSVPVTDRGSEEVNVSFSDFGAGVGLGSGRLLRLALDHRAHACRDCVLTQAHRRNQSGVVINGCAEVWMFVPRAMAKLSEDSQPLPVKWLCLREPIGILQQLRQVVGVDPTVVSPGAISITATPIAYSCRDRIGHTDSRVPKSAGSAQRSRGVSASLANAAVELYLNRRN